MGDVSATLVCRQHMRDTDGVACEHSLFVLVASSLLCMRQVQRRVVRMTHEYSREFVNTLLEATAGGVYAASMESREPTPQHVRLTPDDVDSAVLRR